MSDTSVSSATSGPGLQLTRIHPDGALHQRARHPRLPGHG